MVWFIVMQVFSTLLEWLWLIRKSEREKDLEILLLRRQLEIMTRHRAKPLRISRAEKLTLAVLAAKLRSLTRHPANYFNAVIRIFQPETVFKWHRELVRRKWSYPRPKVGGRPRVAQEIERLIVRLAQENRDWGNGKIEGELIKLGYDVGIETVANILKRHGIPPVPERGGASSWRHLMTHYKDQILACDFFTIETLFLKTVYVFFFIELGSRRIHFAGCTEHPTSAWVTQQARQLTWEVEERSPRLRFLIHDNDSKFTTTFDTVFRAEQMHVIHTPFRAPNANAFAERWVRTVRQECLDKLLILNEAHLRRVLREYVTYYHQKRPHQGLDQQSPLPRPTPTVLGPVRYRRVLSGIIHDYYREAA